MCHALGFQKGDVHAPNPPPRPPLRMRVLRPALPACGPLGTSTLTPVHTVGFSVLSTLASLCAPTPDRVPRHSCFLTGRSHRAALASSSGWQTPQGQKPHLLLLGVLPRKSQILNQPTPANYLGAEKEAACEHSRVGSPIPRGSPGAHHTSTTAGK